MSVNTTEIRQALDRAINEWEVLFNVMGVDTQFTLHTGEQFTVKAVRRKRADENLTDGLQQRTFEIQILARHWQAVAPAGRHPEKGDQIVMAGRRHALEASKLIEFANTQVGYISRVLG